MNTENKNNNNPWFDRFNDLMQTCQTELKRTTQIGKKMLSASQYNAQLHEEYEKLGKLVAKSLKSGELVWSNEAAQEMLTQIDHLKEVLKGHEQEVQDLKKD